MQYRKEIRGNATYISALLIASVCVVAVVPDKRVKPPIVTSSGAFDSITAQQSVVHHKSEKRLAVREINTESLKTLLALGRERDRPLLVNFWATWCEPCRKEMPDLVRVNKQYDSSKLDFITVSLDDVAEIKTSVPQYLQQMNARMSAYLLNVSEPEEAIKAVSDEWAGELPATFLVDQHGRIVFQQTGRIKLDALSVALKTLIKK